MTYQLFKPDRYPNLIAVSEVGSVFKDTMAFLDTCRPLEVLRWFGFVNRWVGFPYALLVPFMLQDDETGVGFVIGVDRSDPCFEDIRNLWKIHYSASKKLPPTVADRQRFVADFAALDKFSDLHLRDANAAFNRGDYAIAMQLWRPLAYLGNAEAQNHLGRMYFEGQGVPQDYVEAVNLFRLAADQGHSNSQSMLGVMYSLGWGAGRQPNYAEGLKWFRLAADQDDAHAQTNLGNVYEKGNGVPQDYVQAHMWFNLAASRLPVEERDDVVRRRDELAARMTPAQIAEAQRLAREWKPQTLPK